jgi:hypothetical protein
MSNFDTAFEKIKKIQTDFKQFCESYGEASEADTRVKLIDKILIEVCGWPESNIKREEHSDSGYSDYILDVFGKKMVIVEAKKEGKTFLFPQDNKSKTLKVSGAILSDQNIKNVIKQVRGYCDDLGVRYAIATNGYSWIIFRAIKENGSWKDGNARIFSSIERILESFTEFWNLLSFDAICKGSLDKEFGLAITPQRQLRRVLSHLNNPDAPLLRNSLHTQLNPVITYFFEDIADPEHIEILKNCYVYSRSLTLAANDINYVIKDVMPKFIKDQKGIELFQGKDDSGDFGESMNYAMTKNNGQLFLLLGGIGSGKTTFQKRYQLTVGQEALNNSIWFVIDFLKPPIDPTDLEPFVWRSILDQLRARYNSPHLETRRNIKRAFKDEIEALKETDLYNLKEGSEEYEKVLTSHLTKWQQNLGEYVPRLLGLAKPRQNLSVVLFFDNVDQLSPHYQSQIFLLAQHITKRTGSITIVALREESYYTASVQKVFTAYINRKFHIASPPFRKMIGLRIKFVLNLFDENAGDNKYFDSIFNSNLFYSDDKSKISDFLKIVENSIFETNKNIARFIDHICFGNMRMALGMFGTFLVSGATDIDKMLHIYRREGSYFVPFHEFLKSIMLGDRMFYKESYSPIINLFECGSERNSSHFTSIRLLSLLNKLKSNYSVEGRGYTDINRIIAAFENKFNNTEDIIKTMNRLLVNQLIEVNTRSTENINNSTHIRIASSGWYYLRYLMYTFSYLDLVLQDTPINSEDVYQKLVNSLYLVNNLGGPDEEKEQRLEERFNRVSIFLNYLKCEEDEENERYNLDKDDSSDFPPIVDIMLERFNRETEYIRMRFKENRQAYLEEKFLNDVEEDFDGLNDENDDYETDPDMGVG